MIMINNYKSDDMSIIAIRHELNTINTI